MGPEVGFCFGFDEERRLDSAVSMTGKGKRNMSNYKLQRTYRLLSQTLKKFNKLIHYEFPRWGNIK